MIVVPAIDLRGGRCVRLVQGDPSAETVYDEDPVAVARRFVAEGATLLHVVDLDAAFGTGSNRDVVAAVCREVDVGVQAGGGLRTPEQVDEALSLGAARVVLGTQAALDPGFLRRAVRRFGERIVVALDVRGNAVMVRGWREEGPRIGEAIRGLEAAGAPRFLVTSIAVDGTLDGPDLALYGRVAGLTERPIIASGGVRTAADLVPLSALGLEAVIVGRALHEGTLKLAEVMGA